MHLKIRIRTIFLLGSILLIQRSNSIFALTDLHTAIINNDLIKVKKIAKDTPSEMKKTGTFKRSDGITISEATSLTLAVLLKNPKMVKALLKFNPDLSEKFIITASNTSMFDATVLHLAANDLTLEIVDLLLNKKADPNAKMKIDQITITPAEIVFKVISNDKSKNENAQSILKSLIWHGAILPKNINAKTLLKREMQFEFIKHAVDHGMNPNFIIKENESNYSVLAYALKNSKKEYSDKLIFFLLNKGANAQDTLKTDDGEFSLLAFAVKEDLDYEIIQALLDKGANAQDTIKTDYGEISLLAFALEESLDYEVIQALLDKGANAQDTIKTDCGEISLLAFSLIEDLDYKIIQALLDKGANAQDTLKTDVGEISLLAFALKDKFVDYKIIKALLNKGANKNVKIKVLLENGHQAEISMFMFGINNENDEKVLELLFDENTDVNEVPRILHLCIELKYEKLVDKLVKAGSNVNSIILHDGKSWSPLMVAIEYYNYTITQLLLNHGAIITQETIDFCTMLKSDKRDRIEEENYQKIALAVTNSLSSKLTILQNSLKILKEKLNFLAKKLSSLKKRLVQVP